MHLVNAGLRFFGGYATVAGGMPLAVGLALADRLSSHHSAARPKESVIPAPPGEPTIVHAGCGSAMKQTAASLLA
jgi:hypothetical protein